MIGEDETNDGYNLDADDPGGHEPRLIGHAVDVAGQLKTEASADCACATGPLPIYGVFTEIGGRTVLRGLHRRTRGALARAEQCRDEVTAGGTHGWVAIEPNHPRGANPDLCAWQWAEARAFVFVRLLTVED